MRPELPTFRTAPVPETPRFWTELERHFDERRHTAVVVPPTLATPNFEQAVHARLAVARTADPFAPIIGVMAAALALVVLTAGLLVKMPTGDAFPSIASPGVPAQVEEPMTGGELVAASFSRWIDGRSEAERLQTRLKEHGYDVSVERIAVASDYTGPAVEVRFATSDRPESIGTDVRGPVVLVIAEPLDSGS